MVVNCLFHLELAIWAFWANINVPIEKKKVCKEFFHDKPPGEVFNRRGCPSLLNLTKVKEIFSYEAIINVFGLEEKIC